MSGAHKSADFAEVNPIQRVPVLILNDGTAISESMAICRYFEAVQPDPSLFGKTPIEIAHNRDVEPARRAQFLPTRGSVLPAHASGHG